MRMPITLALLLSLASCTSADMPKPPPDAAPLEMLDVPLEQVADGHWRADITPMATWTRWTACTEGDAVALWSVRPMAMLAQGAPCIDERSGALADVPLRAGVTYRVVALGRSPVMALVRRAE